MDIFFVVYFLGLGFFIGYFLCRAYKFKIISLYLLGSEVAVIYSLYYIYLRQPDLFLAGLVIQIAFIGFVILFYSRDYKRKNLYETIQRSTARVVFIAGIVSIQEDKIDEVNIYLKRIIYVDADFSGRNLLSIHCVKGIMTLQYKFSNLKDYQLYDNYIALNFKSNEVKKEEKGLTVSYSFKLV